MCTCVRARFQHDVKSILRRLEQKRKARKEEKSSLLFERQKLITKKPDRVQKGNYIFRAKLKRYFSFVRVSLRFFVALISLAENTQRLTLVQS